LLFIVMPHSAGGSRQWPERSIVEKNVDVFAFLHPAGIPS